MRPPHLSSKILLKLVHRSIDPEDFLPSHVLIIRVITNIYPHNSWFVITEQIKFNSSGFPQSGTVTDQEHTILDVPGHSKPHAPLINLFRQTHI